LFAALFSAFPLHVSHGMRSFSYVTHENLFIAVCLLVVSFLYHVFLFLKRIKAQTNIQNFKMKMKTSGKFSGKMFVFFEKRPWDIKK